MSKFLVEFKKVFQEQQKCLLMFPRQQSFFKDLWAELVVNKYNKQYLNEISVESLT